MFRKCVALCVIIFSTLATSGCAEPDRPSISLYRAVHAGDIDQLERHLYWGADLNRANPDGEMPLHVAVRNGRFVITRLLLEHGADIEVTNAQMQTPIYVALMTGRTQIAELLYENGAKLDADYLLHEVTRNQVGDRDVMDFLIAHGADINNLDANGNAPLHTAAQQGYRVVAKMLLARGADVNILNGDKHTPLKLAADNNRPELIDLLKRNGAVLL